MVKNGCILNVSTNNIASFLDKVRLELKDVIREQVLMQTAKSTEWLYDMKFIEQRKYDASILDMALAMTAQRISGVALGAFKDSLFDFRSTLIIAKSGPDHQFQYVLLNAANNFIRYYFENLEEVIPFKFDRFLDEEAPGQEENEAHGIFWHILKTVMLRFFIRLLFHLLLIGLQIFQIHCRVSIWGDFHILHIRLWAFPVGT